MAANTYQDSLFFKSSYYASGHYRPIGGIIPPDPDVKYKGVKGDSFRELQLQDDELVMMMVAAFLEVIE